MEGHAPERRRIAPRQARAQASVDAILEAAARILEADGEPGFNTNAVAERAGVGIGTLYRYFPDKQAILVTLADRERTRVNAEMTAALSKRQGDLAPDRAAIRAFLGAFEGRGTARRAAVKALMAAGDPAEAAFGFSALEAILVDAEGRRLSPVRAFVLTRALHGAMRAAVMEDAAFLHTRAFEDALVGLARSFLGFAPPKVGG